MTVRYMAGCRAHEVLLDVSDAGRAMVTAHWASKEGALAVLNPYQHDKAGEVRAVGLTQAGLLGFDDSKARRGLQRSASVGPRNTSGSSDTQRYRFVWVFLWDKDWI